MKREAPNVLDECLARIASGETVEDCLKDYPALRTELEPLLKTAAAVSALPKVSAPTEFRQSAGARIMSQIKAEARTRQESKRTNSQRSRWFFPRLTDGPASRIALPVALAVVAALVIWWFVPPAVQPVPPQVQAAEIILTTLEGETKVLKEGDTKWQRGEDGLLLSKGDRINTGADSYAVLTFIDGSTAKLEPATMVRILASDYVNGNFARILLEQEKGTVWNHVQNGGHPSEYAVKTPAAKIVAHGTAFATVVESTGATKVNTVDGVVTVDSGGHQVQVAQNQQTEIQPAAPPAVPKLAQPATELVLSTDISAITSIIDPTGASTGVLPNGLSFNQITNSSSTVTPSGHRIDIGRPLAGEYIVVVRSLPQTTVTVRFQVRENGKVVAEHAEVLNGNDEGAWLMRLNMSPGPASAGALSPLAVVEAEPLGSKRPEKVVETELAKAAATPFLNTAVVKPGDSGTAAAPGQATHPATPTQRPTKTTHTPGINPSPTPQGTPPVVKPEHTPGPPSMVPPVTPGKPTPELTDKNRTPDPTDSDKDKHTPKPKTDPTPTDSMSPTSSIPPPSAPTTTIDASLKQPNKSIPSTDASVRPNKTPKLNDDTSAGTTETD